MIIRYCDFGPIIQEAQRLLGPQFEKNPYFLASTVIFLGVPRLKELINYAFDFTAPAMTEDEFIAGHYPYLSSGEQAMAGLAFHFHNRRYQLYPGLEILSSLDKYNYELATLAIHLRYRSFEDIAYDKVLRKGRGWPLPLVYEPADFAERRRVNTMDAARQRWSPTEWASSSETPLDYDEKRAAHHDSH